MYRATGWVKGERAMLPVLRTHVPNPSTTHGLDEAFSPPQSHLRLRGELDHLLAQAQPRLRQLASASGIAPDAADDVVQETLLEAWRSLDHLRNPASFDAWLSGICRNVCRRRARTAARVAAHEMPLSTLAATDGKQHSDTAEAGEPADLRDPQALDPFEALDREDLIALLDQALGYLPPSTREVLELCYFAEVPSREAAERLGVTSNALDVRLYRARRQLGQVLSTDLRAEAEAFGLPLEPVADAGWRETRIWCAICGRHRLEGRFDGQPDGGVKLRLRCPACWALHRAIYVDSDLGRSRTAPRSFLPAYKRSLAEGAQFHQAVIADGYRHLCPGCRQHVVRIQILHATQIAQPTFPGLHYFIKECPRCGVTLSSIALSGWQHPAAQRFIARHPHFVVEPDELVDFRGQHAYRFRMTDLASAARLTAFAHAETLAVLATFEE
jgi:RNA polymerase sigma-70 factor (ECF subfamily)